MVDTLAFMLLSPFDYPFMVRALLASVLVGTVCALLSCFLVLKGWALMGDAVSHAVLPGLALAYVVGLPLSVGAFLAGVFCAIATGWVKWRVRVKEDAVMGILFSGLFALGLVLVTQIETDVHLLHVLFGNLLGISWRMLAEMSVIGVIVIGVLIVKWRDFQLYCFDMIHARALGLRVGVIHYALLILLALSVVSALQAVGIILVVALLIAPGAIGFLCARSFVVMMAVSVGCTVVAAAGGVIISFHADVAPAPTIVLILSVFFIFALFRQMQFRSNGMRKAL